MSTEVFSQHETELRNDGLVVPRVPSTAVLSPSVGQIIYATNTSNLSYFNGSSWEALDGIFERDGNLIRQKEGQHSDDLIFGRDGLPSNAAISGTMFFFDKSKGAFRGGELVSSTNWAPSLIGEGSFAYGINTKADGRGSTALGTGTMSEGLNATAMGNFTTASGESATSIGNNSIATGDVSIAMGSSTIAAGLATTAMGLNSKAFGVACTSLGLYNDPIVVANQGITATSPLLIIGNGDAGAGNESNAMVVRKDGRVGLGENDPDAMLHIYSGTSGSATGLKITSAGGLQANSMLYHDADGHLHLRKQSQDDQLVLGSTGRVGLGIIPASNKLEVEGQASKTFAGLWVANSDRRIKTDIQGVDNATEILEQLHPVKFKYTEEWRARHPSIKDHYYYNFIAQDFQKIFPDAVQGSGEYLENDDTEILQIDAYNAQIVTIAAVKELIQEIEELRTENVQYKKDLEELRLMIKRHITTESHEAE